MYTLEEYNLRKNNFDYQKLLLDENINNIRKIFNRDNSKLHRYIVYNKIDVFPDLINISNKLLPLFVIQNPLNIRYIKNVTEKLVNIALSGDPDEVIKYIDINKFDNVYQKYLNIMAPNCHYLFTKYIFHKIQNDFNYQISDPDICFSQIINPSQELINFWIKNKWNLIHVSEYEYLTETQQLNILNNDAEMFPFFKNPSLAVIHKAIYLNPENIEFIDLEFYPELYDYYRLLVL